jgi:putative tryptophan/tyrosine transport system substrate-binding protein
MKKAALPSILVAVLLAVGVTAEAQQPTKVARIGILFGASPSANAGRGEAFRKGLHDLGYIEGKNIVIEDRYAEGKLDRLPALIAELLRLSVDLIVTAGPAVTRPVKEATSTIPIVMAFDSDPVGSGFVASLARPGGNVTGITLLSRGLGSKRLELLKEAVPKLARVAVLYDPAIPGIVHEVKQDLPVGARGLGLAVQPWEVRDASGFEKVFAALNKQRPDGLYVPGGRAVSIAIEQLVAFALKSRLPSMYQSRDLVEAGGLMSYGADLADSYRRVAYYVDRILKGAKPGDLPVEQPTKFEFVINLKTAKQIGLTIPQSMLYRADKVIK